MPIPDLEESGELPAGIHIATLVEIEEKFGRSSDKRSCISWTEIFGNLLRLRNSISAGMRLKGNMDWIFLSQNGTKEVLENLSPSSSRQIGMESQRASFKSISSEVTYDYK